jgi:hypothetical protein
MAALALTLPATAAAATRYAAPTPAGVSDCSSPANACWLRSAVDGAAQGDRVVVLPGTYWLSSTLTPISDVSVSGQPGSRPVIRMTGPGSLGDYEGLNKPVTVSNLELRSSGQQPLVTLGVNATLSHVIVQMTVVVDGLVAVTATPGARLADDVIRALGWGAPTGVRVVALPPGSPGVTTLLNDTVVSTEGVAIEVTSGSTTLPPPHCAGFQADASLVNVIAHGRLGGLETDSSNSSPADCAPQSLVTAKYSNYDGVRAYNGAVTNGGHNQTGIAVTNPGAIFRAYPTNLHERPGAPTINAGYSQGLESTDLDGNPRIIGPAADIGAYELRPGAARSSPFSPLGLAPP